MRYTILESCFIRVLDYVIPLMFVQDCSPSAQKRGKPYWCTKVFGPKETVVLTQTQLKTELQREIKMKNFDSQTKEKIKKLLNSGFENAKMLDDVVRNNDYYGNNKHISLLAEILPPGRTVSEIETVSITRHTELEQLIKTRLNDIESIRFSEDASLFPHQRNKKSYQGAYFYTIVSKDKKRFLRGIDKSTPIWTTVPKQRLRFSRYPAAKRRAEEWNKLLPPNEKGIHLLEDSKYHALSQAKDPIQYLELYASANSAEMEYLNKLFNWLLKVMDAANQNVSVVFGSNFGTKVNSYLENLFLLKKWSDGQITSETLQKVIDWNIGTDDFCREIDAVIVCIKHNLI